MTTQTNYMSVNDSTYSVGTSDSEDSAATLKEKIMSLIYPATGIVGIAGQLYQLLFC